MSAAELTLAGRIRALLTDLDHALNEVERLTNKAQQANDADFYGSAALDLHTFYGAVERIFEDIARNMEGLVPSGPDWHQTLLLQMSTEMSGVRPPVIRRETRICLDEYRSFRHRVRNVYAFNLRPTQVRELSQDLRACYESFLADVTAFLAFLETLY